MTARDIGLEEALEATLSRLEPLDAAAVPVWDAVDLVLAAEARARVDSPSVTCSAKDGFAVLSADVRDASPERPVRLAVTGEGVAGGRPPPPVEPGCAVRVTTGAALPAGADAVVAEEFTARGPGGRSDLEVRRDAAPGRNLIERGSDVAAGEVIAAAATTVTPALTGLLAAGGLDQVRAIPRPRVGLLATGDEVVAPGRPLRPGQLYASNVVTLCGWLRSFGMESRVEVAADDPGALRDAVRSLAGDVDAIVTSGGAWKSQRDLSPAVVTDLGGELVFHRVRLAPGKAVAFGLLGRLPVFCLPGGPPSNEMAFLQIALPGLLRLAGRRPTPFRRARARLTRSVSSRHADRDWTYFFQVSLERVDGRLEAEPMRWRSRLQCQAHADGIVRVPDGEVGVEAGAEAEVQVFRDDPSAPGTA